MKRERPSELPKEVKVRIDRLAEIEAKLDDLAIELKSLGVKPEGIPAAKRTIRERIGFFYCHLLSLPPDEKRA